MICSPSLLATMVLESPWNIVGLVMSIVIVLIPLVGVLGVYYKLAKRPPHKPVEIMPLAGQDRPAMLTDERV